MLNCILLSSVVLSETQPGSNWRVVEALFDETKKPIIAEYWGPLPSRPAPKDRSPDERVRQFSMQLDSVPTSMDVGLVLVAKYLPLEMRQLDNLRTWSASLAKPQISGVSEVEPGIWKFRLPQGVCISVSDLKKLKVLNYSTASPWFESTRFIIRADKISSDDLKVALLTALGGEERKMGSMVYYRIKGQAYGDKRIRLAAEQIRRNRAPATDLRQRSNNQFDNACASIELSLLRGAKPSVIEELFSSASNELIRDAKEVSGLIEAIEEKLAVIRRSLKPGSLQIAEGSRVFGRLAGNGNAGGLIINKKGWRTAF